MKRTATFVPALLAIAFSFTAPRAESQAPAALDFDPRVGVVGFRVVVKTGVPNGAQLLFGGKQVSYFREPDGSISFTVPEGAVSSFVEITQKGRTLAKSSVPFVVAGRSIVSTPKLVGLKEAIDVFGYVDSTPDGGRAPEPKARPILTFGEDSIVTIGEPLPYRMYQAVELGDASSFLTRGMGQPGMLLTIRPPQKKLTVPTPTPQ